MKTILIHPGYLEDEHHFGRVTRELRLNGYDVRIHECYKEGVEEAYDLNLTHSAGILCRSITTTKIPLLGVAPPLVNHRIKRKIIVKFFGDATWAMKNRELTFWLYKSSLSFLALFSYKKWYFMATSLKEYSPNLDEILNAKHIKIIVNSQDPFTRTLCDDKRCVLLEGNHDDLLYRPKEYILNIKQLLERS